VWTFTTVGMFSVIQHRDDKDLLLVRARVKGDLENLRDKFLPNLGKIAESPNADYPYRALAWKTDYAEAMKRAVMAIDYTNYKSEVTKTQGSERHDVYMRIWGIMRGAEEDMARSKKKAANWEKQGTLFEPSKNFNSFAEYCDKKYEKKHPHVKSESRAFTDSVTYFDKQALSESNREIEAEVARHLKGTKDDFDIEALPETMDQELDALSYSYGAEDLWCPTCRIYGGHEKSCKEIRGCKK